MNVFTITIVPNFSKVNLLWCLDNNQRYAWSGQITDAVCSKTHHDTQTARLCGWQTVKLLKFIHLFNVEVLSNPAITILSVPHLNSL